MRPLYVAATGQHVGKTTSTLGLVNIVKDLGYSVGYCKPVGQQHLKIGGQLIDKDVTLFAQTLGFSINGKLHSPVVIAKGVTKQFIDNPEDFHFREAIQYSASILQDQHDIVIYEGTGHPGVGAVADVSNAEVAKMLNAGVLMIAEGGIGSTIDELVLSISQFKLYKVPILGIIVNKVLPEKSEQVAHYVGKKLKTMDLDLLGVLPFDKRMSFPLMETVRTAVNGRCIVNDDMLDNRIEDIVAGSLVDIKEFSSFKNILLVVSAKRLEDAISKVKSVAELKNLSKSPLSGIILTGDGSHTYLEGASLKNEYILKHNIPVVTTALDTYGSVIKISRIEVKINTRTPWKTQRAIELINENVNVGAILQKLELL